MYIPTSLVSSLGIQQDADGSRSLIVSSNRNLEAGPTEPRLKQLRANDILNYLIPNKMRFLSFFIQEILVTSEGASICQGYAQCQVLVPVGSTTLITAFCSGRSKQHAELKFSTQLLQSNRAKTISM